MFIFPKDSGGCNYHCHTSFHVVVVKLFILLMLCQFYLNPYNFVYSAIYTNEFAVNIPGGESVANEIARKHGFVNRGQVGSLENYFLFEHHKIEKRSLEDSGTHSKLLQEDPSVVWFEQQVVKRRVKRNIKRSFAGFQDPLYPEQWFLHGGGSGSNDMNVIPAWEAGYTGKGVVVSILDDGIQGNHPDLAQNYDKEASYDINDSDDDPTPQDNDDNKVLWHGTRCAGEVAAVANNEFCGVGIAYNASIGGVRMLDGSVTDVIEASALSLRPNHIHIYSASWGPEDDGKTVDGPGRLAERAFEKGITQGRGGLGSIFVWASGNGGGHSDNCNCDGYTNSIFTISISSATQSGLKPWYLEECSSTIATTYSSGTSTRDKNIVTVDVDLQLQQDLKHGVKSTSTRLCTKSHTGTSASAPIAAAICALALEANPNLSWRDMQHLIVLTSRPQPLLNERGWKRNGIGRRISTMFGFGLMDAAAMVDLAKKWKPVSEQFVCYSSSDTTERVIPSYAGKPLETSITTTGCKNQSNSVKYLEHVKARISLHYHTRGALHITLISPAGTKSDLLLPRPHDRVEKSFTDWPFMSVHFWGESPEGTWTLRILNDEMGSSAGGKLTNWSLVFYGTQVQSRSSYTYTGDFDDNSDAEKEFEQTNRIHGYHEYSEPLSVCSKENKFYNSEIEDCVEKCPLGKYGDRTDAKCHICDKSCSLCYGPSKSNCLSCHKNFLYKNKCLKSCPEGFFGDPSHHVCYPCPSTCVNCESNGLCNGLCKSCKPGFFLHNQKCISICPDGTFSQELVCQNCHESCASCYGPHANQCSSCPESFLLHNSSCNQECPDNYFPTENFMCQRCYRSCKSCIGSDMCSSCNDEWEEANNECSYPSPCDKGWSNEVQSTCETCFSNCQQCTGPEEGDCMLCEPGFYWLEGRCTEQCPDGYFLSKDECNKCPKLCTKCDISGKCLSCTKGFLLYFGKCYSDCPSGFYDNGNGKCEMCHPECLHCNGFSKFNCTSCRKDSYLVNYSCQPECPVGYFPTSNMDQNECLPCYSTCKSCSGFGPGHCQSCPDNSSFTEGKCIPCFDQELFNNASKKCEKCPYNCARCFGPNGSKCLSCNAPWRLDKSNQICLQCCSNRQMSNCCICSKDLSVCLFANHPNEVNLSSQEVSLDRDSVLFVFVICAIVALLFACLFTLLQVNSMGLCKVKCREQQYERVPNNLTEKFDVDSEKVSLTTQDEIDVDEEEEEIYRKI